MPCVKLEVSTTIGGSGNRPNIFFNLICKLDSLVGHWLAIAVGDIDPDPEIKVQWPSREREIDVDFVISGYRVVLI